MKLYSTVNVYFFLNDYIHESVFIHPNTHFSKCKNKQIYKTGTKSFFQDSLLVYVIFRTLY